MILRWPLFAVELLLSLIALILAAILFLRQTPGYRQVPIIMPWLLANALFSAWLLYETRTTFGFVLLYDANVVIVYSLLIAGPASIITLCLVRLWKHGSRR